MSRPLGDAEPLKTTHEDRLGRVVVSGVLFLPFLVNGVSQLLGFEIFYVADPMIQVVWGFLAQLFGGVPLYRQALEHLRHGGNALALWSALLTTAAFLGSLFTALLRPEWGVYFWLSALVTFLYFARRFLLTRRSH